jgi:multiple sugar transport system permease protein
LSFIVASHSKGGIKIIMRVSKSTSVQKVTAMKSVGKEKVRTLGQVTQITFKYAVLLILSISYVLPLVWMAVSALKVDSQVYTIPPIWIPIPAHWNNFVDAWTSYNFNLYVFNTVFKYAIPATFLTVVSSSLVAYAFSRLRWRSRNFLFAICLMTMMIPSQVTMVPLFITYKHLGWLNTYLPLVAPSFFGDAYFIFLLRQFFLGIPQDLSDAAKIDGCNELAILWRIVLPLSVPALAVVALFRFLWAWNDYFGPLIYLNQEAQFTVALGIENLRRTMEQVGSRLMAYPYLMAVSTIVTIPVLVAFFIAQRTFIEGISMTGIKG